MKGYEMYGKQARKKKSLQIGMSLFENNASTGS